MKAATPTRRRTTTEHPQPGSVSGRRVSPAALVLIRSNHGTPPYTVPPRVQRPDASGNRPSGQLLSVTWWSVVHRPGWQVHRSPGLLGGKACGHARQQTDRSAISAGTWIDS